MFNLRWEEMEIFLELVQEDTSDQHGESLLDAEKRNTASMETGEPRLTHMQWNVCLIIEWGEVTILENAKEVLRITPWRSNGGSFWKISNTSFKTGLNMRDATTSNAAFSLQWIKTQYLLISGFVNQAKVCRKFMGQLYRPWRRSIYERVSSQSTEITEVHWITKQRSMDGDRPAAIVIRTRCIKLKWWVG